MERITEIMHKFPVCCLKDTFGLASCAPEKRSGVSLRSRCFTIFLRVAVNLLPVGPDDNGNTHFSEPLRRRCGRGAASGVCLVPPDLPLFDCGYSLGAGSESDRLVDHGDEFCWLSLPSTGLFGWRRAQFPHYCRETKPRRAPATGSPIAP